MRTNLIDNAVEEAHKDFGRFLEEQLLKFDMTATDATRKAELTLSQWSRITNGRSGTRRSTIPRIASAFGIGPDDPRIDEFYRRAGYEPPSRPDLRSNEALSVMEYYAELPDHVRSDVETLIEALWRKHVRRQAAFANGSLDED